MIRFNDITIDTATRTITRPCATVNFQRALKFTLMCDLLLAGGVTKEQLFDWRYGRQLDGGPLDGFHIFDVFMAQLKPQYRALHLVLRKDKRGGKNYYWLEPNVV